MTALKALVTANANRNIKILVDATNPPRVNLDRTQIQPPVNGYVTNLLAQLGDYANIGQIKISLVDADSFWVDGYFEESNLESIREGDPATIKLMGYSQLVRGHVDSISRGINVLNARPNASGLAADGRSAST